MIIKYKNTKIKRFLESKEAVSKKYSEEIFMLFRQKIEILTKVNNLSKAVLINKGMKIKKLKTNKYFDKKHFYWSFRINKKYRCEYLTEKENDISIIEILTVNRIHPHKYKK